MARRKRKVKEAPSDELAPTKFQGLPGLARAEEFENKYIHKKRGEIVVNNEMENHKAYYKYEKSTIEDQARDYLLENGEEELLPFLLTLIEIQKTRMDPKLFKSLEGNCYRWKYEEILEGPYIWKSNVKSSSSNDSDGDGESKSDSNSNSNSNSETNQKTNNNDDSDSDKNKNNNESKRASHNNNKDKEIPTEYIKAVEFAKKFQELKNSRISLELKKGTDFVPWIYLKTVVVEGEETIGVFAGRSFPAQSAIGFYISYP
jgi:hypothetical protein